MKGHYLALYVCCDDGFLQVLVYHDLLGMMQHPHYVKVTPKFCKQYASVGTVIQEALQSYRDEVQHLFAWPALYSRLVGHRHCSGMLLCTGKSAEHQLVS